jgi:hypothetical protein
VHVRQSNGNSYLETDNVAEVLNEVGDEVELLSEVLNKAQAVRERERERQRDREKHPQQERQRAIRQAGTTAYPTSEVPRLTIDERMARAKRFSTASLISPTCSVPSAQSKRVRRGQTRPIESKPLAHDTSKRTEQWRCAPTRSDQPLRTCDHVLHPLLASRGLPDGLLLLALQRVLGGGHLVVQRDDLGE